MPKEIRRLAFTHAEATQALQLYCKKNKMTLPGGTILHARFAMKDEEAMESESLAHDKIFQTYNAQKSKDHVILTFYNDDTLSNTHFNIKADSITAALIEYALDNAIMLPKAGAKTLDITEFNMCLDINMKIATTDEEELTLEDDKAEQAKA